MASADPALPPVSPVTGRVVLRVRMPQRLRNIELALLLVALGLSALALALVQWGALGELDWSLLTYAAGLAGLTLGVHLALRLVARDADPFIVPIATMLNGLGITMIHRLDLAAGATGWQAGHGKGVAQPDGGEGAQAEGLGARLGVHLPVLRGEARDVVGGFAVDEEDHLPVAAVADRQLALAREADPGGVVQAREDRRRAEAVRHSDEERRADARPIVAGADAARGHQSHQGEECRGDSGRVHWVR